MDELRIPPDPIGITNAEYVEIQSLTKRFNHGAKAIFSVTRGGDIFASGRHGNTPVYERDYIDDTVWVLDQLKKSLTRHRLDGGRMFVDSDGAYWKKAQSGETKKVRFAHWRWKDDPRKQVPASEWHQLAPLLRRK